MSDVIFVVCEADADHRTGCGLIDRILCQHVDWIEAETLHAFRTYRGSVDSERFVAWGQLKQIARRRGLRPHGHFEGQPILPDAAAVRLALLLAADLQTSDDFDRVSAVVLLRDHDGDDRRIEGFSQAIGDHDKWPFPVVTGIARSKRECWVLAGFDPQSESERTRFDQIREELGFDPRYNAERLTAKHDYDKLSAKRVLKVLIQDDFDREQACWNKTALDILKERGLTSGLAKYLGQVVDKIVPLFVNHSAHSS